MVKCSSLRVCGAGGGVMMISNSIEISIARGVGEMVCVVVLYSCKIVLYL